MADLRCRVCNEPCGPDFVSAVLGQGGVDGDVTREPDDDAPVFLFTVSPCCGRRGCVEALWNKAAENLDVGSIETEEVEESPDSGYQERREPELTESEKAFLDEEDDVLVEKAGDWLRDHPEVQREFPYPSSLDSFSLSSHALTSTLLREVFNFPEDRAESISRSHLWGGSERGPSALRRKVEGLRRGLRARAEAREEEKAAQDLENSESLVPECVEWASGLGLKTLRQADVEVFLSEKGKDLMHSRSIRNLWTKASLALRVQKARGSQR